MTEETNIVEQRANVAANVMTALMGTGLAHEWQSVTLNITAGPNEAPVVHAAFLPGTTKENALRIQKAFLIKGAEVNG